MKKIIILGSTGMAGHLITYYLTQLNKYEIINVSRSKLNENTILIDAYNINSVEKLLNEKKPNVLINCIGVLIKESERYPDRAIYINSFFPRYLERLGKEMNFKLIHLSTDCVFSGKKGDYIENDLKNASDIYGRSKALGEVMNNKQIIQILRSESIDINNAYLRTMRNRDLEEEKNVMISNHDATLLVSKTVSMTLRNIALKIEIILAKEIILDETA